MGASAQFDAGQFDAPQFDASEVVIVIDDHCLIDPESYQRSYRTADGRPLERGHYVVRWPVGTPLHGYDRHARFHGPYATRREAEHLGALLRMGDGVVPRPAQPPTYTPSRPVTQPPLTT